MKAIKSKAWLYVASMLAVAVAGMIYYYLFSAFSRVPSTTYIFIDDDDSQDSVFAKLSVIGTSHGLAGFHALARHSSYAEHVRPGRYGISPGECTFSVFRHLKNGMQSPVSLTIPEARTVEKLAATLSRKLMADSATIVACLKDSAVCARLGYDTATIAALFIPNTYDVYWNISVEQLLERMLRENKQFWKADNRQQLANDLGLSTTEVTTLASIIDEETANNAEKPMIAGMYLNRLNFRSAEYPDGMPLQADPTVKYAVRDFTLRRIYHKLLFTDSPYNTYKYPGLPPGPIKIASIAGIDAVLHCTKHDYLYMCAKEDFSGKHNFAKTYSEHLKNAARYSKALNERGIK